MSMQVDGMSMQVDSHSIKPDEISGITGAGFSLHQQRASPDSISISSFQDQDSRSTSDIFLYFFRASPIKS
jgi:hypothetical protein